MVNRIRFRHTGEPHLLTMRVVGERCSEWRDEARSVKADLSDMFVSIRYDRLWRCAGRRPLLACSKSPRDTMCTPNSCRCAAEAFPSMRCAGGVATFREFVARPWPGRLWGGDQPTQLNRPRGMSKLPCLRGRVAVGRGDPMMSLNTFANTWSSHVNRE